jgi:hypothetical protein
VTCPNARRSSVHLPRLTGRPRPDPAPARRPARRGCGRARRGRVWSQAPPGLGADGEAGGLAGSVPVIVADCGYGRSVSIRLALEERGWSYSMAVEPKEVARPASAEPHLPPYPGLGPPTLPRYREPARPLHHLINSDTRFETVTWHQGSKGSMTSRFAVLEVRPSGKEATRTAQEHAGGRSRWNGAAVADPAGRTTGHGDRAHRLLDDQPARHHPDRRSGPMGQDALAHRARLPRARTRPGPGPLRRPHLARSAPPRHPRDRAQAFLTLRRYDPKARTAA